MQVLNLCILPVALPSGAMEKTFVSLLLYVSGATPLTRKSRFET